MKKVLRQIFFLLWKAGITNPAKYGILEAGHADLIFSLA